MKNGRVIPNATGEAVQVEYDLWVTGRNDAGGRIRIGDDPVPGHRFMGAPAAAFPGNVNCVLETAGGIPVHIFFTKSDGTFVCQLADEARDALSAGG